MGKRIKWEDETLHIMGRYHIDDDLLYWTGFSLFVVFLVLTGVAEITGLWFLAVPFLIFVGSLSILGLYLVLRTFFRAWRRVLRGERKVREEYWG